MLRDPNAADIVHHLLPPLAFLMDSGTADVVHHFFSLDEVNLDLHLFLLISSITQMYTCIF